MFEVDKIDRDIQYMNELRSELRRIKVTPERLRRLEISLTTGRVAYAIKKYVVEIEKREKNKAIKKTNKRQP